MSYAMDCSEPERERIYTRPVAAEMLIDAGATVERTTWEQVIMPGASAMLQLLAKKTAPPRSLDVLAALGDAAAIRARLDGAAPIPHDGEAGEQLALGNALMSACRFSHTALALLLLERAIALDPELGRRIDRWQGREAFVAFLIR